MAAVPGFSGAQNGATLGAGVTGHYSVGVGGSRQNTEVDVATTFRTPGTLSLLTCTISANATTGTATIRTRKNLANGVQVLSIGAGQTGQFTDTTNSEAVTAGDEWAIRVTGISGGTLTLQAVGTVFAAAADTVSHCVSNYWGNQQVGGATRYTAILGYMSMSTTEDPVEITCPVAMTAKNAGMYIDANSCPGAGTLTLRVNGADSALDLSVPATTTGVFEDTVTTVAIAAGQTVSWENTLGGASGGWRSEWIVVDLVSSAKVGLGGGTRSWATAATTTRYHAPVGYLDPYTSEAAAQVRASQRNRLQNLGAHVATNGVNGASTLRSRVNGANGNLAVSIPQSTTGHVVDSSGKDNLAEGDLWNVAMVAGGATGTITLGVLEFTLTVVGGGGGNNGGGGPGGGLGAGGGGSTGGGTGAGPRIQTAETHVILGGM